MSAPKRVKDLGHVIDGRIRKGWPFQRLRFGGLRQREPDVARSKGLLNPSVLCYRNAVLQCLLHCSEFFLYLGRQDRCATPGDNCVFCALQGLANEYWTNTAAGPRQQALANVNTAMESHQEPDMTYDFLRRAGSDDNDMSASGQQDAHEYLIGLINMLKHINNHRIHGHNIRNVAVNSLFNLRTKATWTCQDCDEVHVTRRKDVCINLAMPEKPTQRTLDWYLEQHFAADESQNGLQCDTAACKGNARDRKREFSIVGGPEILVIQLIRMRYNRHTDRMEKVMDRVGYPEKLDLSQWSEGSLAYQLNGIVSHSGTSLKGGHYIATVRSQSGDDFARCNDHVVHDRWPRGRILARAESATMQSYLLVYQKIGGRMAKCI